jgi:ribonucleoside-diphosphate reductase alpha chain
MIDARDQVMSPASSQVRRRSKLSNDLRAARPGTISSRKTLPIQRVFSDPKVKPFDQIEWERRTAEITDDSGKVIFKQENVEVPKTWSQLATKVVVSKYFYGELDTAERETSVRQLIQRVCRTIADWGVKDGYFSAADGEK